MIKKHILSIIICLTFQTVKGSIPEKESVKDSIHLNEVIVTGSMTEVNRRYLPMTVSVINSDDIENRYNSSIRPLLSEEIPGMFVIGRGVMGYAGASSYRRTSPPRCLPDSNDSTCRNCSRASFYFVWFQSNGKSYQYYHKKKKQRTSK